MKRILNIGPRYILVNFVVCEKRQYVFVGLVPHFVGVTYMACSMHVLPEIIDKQTSLAMLI